jgi:micrococcal nuclease
LTAGALSKIEIAEIRGKYRERCKKARMIKAVDGETVRDWTVRNLAKAYKVHPNVVWRCVETQQAESVSPASPASPAFNSPIAKSVSGASDDAEPRKSTMNKPTPDEECEQLHDELRRLQVRHVSAMKLIDRLRHIAGYHYRGTLLHTVDGDTVDMEIDLGFYVHTRMRFRLEGIDTPERGQTGYDTATEHLNRLLKDRDICVESSKTGKFGRWLATLYVGEKNINKQMIKDGYAKVYG